LLNIAKDKTEFLDKVQSIEVHQADSEDEHIDVDKELAIVNAEIFEQEQQQQLAGSDSESDNDSF
jgi:hypothetical protein